MWKKIPGVTLITLIQLYHAGQDIVYFCYKNRNTCECGSALLNMTLLGIAFMKLPTASFTIIVFCIQLFLLKEHFTL